MQILLVGFYFGLGDFRACIRSGVRKLKLHTKGELFSPTQLLNCPKHLICSPGFSSWTWQHDYEIHLHNACPVASLAHPQTTNCLKLWPIRADWDFQTGEGGVLKGTDAKTEQTCTDVDKLKIIIITQ